MINYEKGVVKYSSQFVVSQIIQGFFSYCRVKRLLVSHVQQTMLSFICSRPKQIHLIISCSTTVAVMVIMEQARLLFSASCITGNVRWPHEHENDWCFDWVKKLCKSLSPWIALGFQFNFEMIFTLIMQLLLLLMIFNEWILLREATC